MNLGKVFLKWYYRRESTFVQVIGMCPTLAVTSAAINGLGMGLSTTVVLSVQMWRYHYLKSTR